jgi:methionine-rich copper-binding protein CopC
LYVVSEEGGGNIDKPQLQVYAPKSSKTAAGVGSNFYLTFNQPISVGTGNITLSNGAGDTRTIAITDATQISISGNTLKINPSTDLVAGSTYAVTYAAGVIKNTSGKDAPAVTGTTLGFTTYADAIAPSLLSSTPTDDASGITGNHIVLTFNEAVKAGTGNIIISNGLGDTRTIPVTDITQVTISGRTVDINPSADLIKGVAYNVQFASGVIKDLAGNNFAGLTSPTVLNFSTVASTSIPTLLITEVNSNATGGDFFELFNYGTTEVDLTGFKWDDDSANPASGASFPSGTKIAAGQRIVVLSESINADAFKTAWGNPANLTVVTATTAPSGLGLGGSGDAVVLFDATGKTVAWFNYKLTDITTALPEAKVLTPSVAVDGITRTAVHAGPSFGATGTLATTSAVWDGVSVISPKYKAAISGELDAFTSGALIGSPGR